MSRVRPFATPIRFNVGEVFSIQKNVCRLEHRIGAKLEFRRIDTQEVFSFTLDQFAAQHARGEIAKIAHSTSGANFEDISENDPSWFFALSSSDEKKALERLRYVLLLEEINNRLQAIRRSYRPNLEAFARRAIRVAFRSHGERTLAYPPGYSTVQAWRKKWNARGQLLSALVPNHQASGNRQSRLQREVRDLLVAMVDEYAYGRNFRSNVSITNDLNAEIFSLNKGREPQKALPYITEHAVRLELDRRDQFILNRSRYGEGKALSKSGVSGIRAPASYPNEWWEIDHSSTDILLFSIKERLLLGVATLAYCVDQYTDMPMGYAISFNPPSILLTGKCFLNAISSKKAELERYGCSNDWPAMGLPANIRVDKGPDFTSHSFAAGMAEMGVRITHTPAKRPWLKSIERRFLTLQKGLLHQLPGTTLGSYVDRRDYDPSKFALMAWEDFLPAFHHFIVNEVVWRPTAAHKKAPIDQWRESSPEEYMRLPASADFSRFTLGRHVPNRNISSGGITYHYLQYRSPQLDRLRACNINKVDIRVDEDDLSAIGVVAPNGERFKAYCTDARYSENLTMYAHKTIMEENKAANRDPKKLENLHAGRKRMNEIIEQSMKRGNKGWGHRKATRATGKYDSWKTDSTLPMGRSDSVPGSAGGSFGAGDKGSKKARFYDFDLADWD